VGRYELSNGDLLEAVDFVLDFDDILAQSLRLLGPVQVLVDPDLELLYRPDHFGLGRGVRVTKPDAEDKGSRTSWARRTTHSRRETFYLSCFGSQNALLFFGCHI